MTDPTMGISLVDLRSELVHNWVLLRWSSRWGFSCRCGIPGYEPKAFSICKRFAEDHVGVANGLRSERLARLASGLGQFGVEGFDVE